MRKTYSTNIHWKWKWKSLSRIRLFATMDYSSDSPVHGILQDTGVGSHSLPQGSSQLRDWTRSPTLQVHSLPYEPPGKPRNTREGGLTLLQQIFPTQESNWGLLHCKWILYQLSYKGIPKTHTLGKNKILTSINVRAEIDKNVNKKKRKINEINKWLFEKINKIDKPLARLTSTKREKM